MSIDSLSQFPPSSLRCTADKSYVRLRRAPNWEVHSMVRFAVGVLPGGRVSESCHGKLGQPARSGWIFPSESAEFVLANHYDALTCLKAYFHGPKVDVYPPDRHPEIPADYNILRFPCACRRRLRHALRARAGNIKIQVLTEYLSPCTPMAEHNVSCWGYAWPNPTGRGHPQSPHHHAPQFY